MRAARNPDSIQTIRAIRDPQPTAGEYTLQVEGDRLVYEVISETPWMFLAGTSLNPTVVTPYT
jgi:hypothetical protein